MAQDHASGADGEVATSPDRLTISEEQLRVEKRLVTTGKVRIRTFVDAVEDTVRTTLEEEQVEVTRVPIDRVVDQAPAVHTKDGVTIVPVLEEVLFVEKRLLLKEELHIRRRVAADTVEVPVTLRKERVSIERVASDGETLSTEEIKI